MIKQSSNSRQHEAGVWAMALLKTQHRHCFIWRWLAGRVLQPKMAALKLLRNCKRIRYFLQSRCRTNYRYLRAANHDKSQFALLWNRWNSCTVRKCPQASISIPSQSSTASSNTIFVKASCPLRIPVTKYQQMKKRARCHIPCLPPWSSTWTCVFNSAFKSIALSLVTRLCWVLDSEAV